MSWDFILDRKTGDWVFDGNTDSMGVDGDELIRQRIFIRMKIPRGTFIYDTNKTLGSRAYQALRFSSERNIRDLPSIVFEALEEMTDISISNVDVTADEETQSARVTVHYKNIVLPGEAALPDAISERASIFAIPLPVGPNVSVENV